MKKRRLLSVVLMMIAVLVMSLNAQAAVKTVKSIDYKQFLTSEIKKGATTVKQGSTRLKVVDQGYLKFTAPSTSSYSFTFSGLTGGDDENLGQACFQNKHMEDLMFDTEGGKTDTAFFAARNSAENKNHIEADLGSRTCKLSLKKGQVVYIYLCFNEKGTIKLKIGSLKPTISDKKITIKVNKTYKLSVKNAPGPIKWTSSDTTVAKVYKSGKVKGFKAGKAVITAKTGGKKYTCKVTVTGNQKKEDNGSKTKEKNPNIDFQMISGTTGYNFSVVIRITNLSDNPITVSDTMIVHGCTCYDAYSNRESSLNYACLFEKNDSTTTIGSGMSKTITYKELYSLEKFVYGGDADLTFGINGCKYVYYPFSNTGSYQGLYFG